MTGQCTPVDIREDSFEYFDRLAQLKVYCQQNSAGPISLDSAAAVCGMEPTYFSAYFHEKVGVCYICWLNHLRVLEAKDLFQDHHAAIRETGVAVGFTSLSSFERAFKRSTGMTAIAYRKQQNPG